MSITHEQARRLIQLGADNALNSIDHHLLEAHLSSCPECQNYAATFHDLESTLQPLLQRRWNKVPLPLSTGGVVSRKSTRFIQSLSFATRIMAVGLLSIAFLFNIWQFTRSGRQGADRPLAEIPLLPTPSMQSTTTKALNQDCEPVLYRVRQNDTLESIAIQFSVSKDGILQANHLGTAAFDTTMQLSIPVCSPTPSGRPHIATTTFTPLPGASTFTPANGPTQ